MISIIKWDKIGLSGGNFCWMKNHKTSFRANSDDDIGKDYWCKIIIDRKKTSNVTT